MDQLSKAIDKTIKYGQGFGVEYGVDEIKERLISKNVYLDEEIVKAIQIMQLNLPGTTKKVVMIKKVAAAKKLASVIEKYFPDILMIAITGSVAAGYPTRDDDIDLMIVTRPNRLWLTRLLLRIYVLTKRIPHRKIGFKEVGNEFCFNLWLESDNLPLPLSKETLQNAMDSILMIPILNRELTYEKFINNNNWIGNYVAKGYKKIVGTIIKSEKEGDKKHSFLTVVNWLVYWPQFWYMKRKISGEVIDLKRAFFHPSDRIRYVN